VAEQVFWKAGVQFASLEKDSFLAAVSSLKRFFLKFCVE
jgi:hypothetical protein